MKCNKDCLHCALEACVEDRQIFLDLPPKKRDRRDYYKKYYQEKTKAKKGHKRANYYYMNKRQTLDAIRKLKRKIGQVNTQLVIDALDQLDTIIYEEE